MTQTKDSIIKEIKRVECSTLNVRKEVKALKKRVGKYKSWTKRYRKQTEELKQEKEKLKEQVTQLLLSIEAGKSAKEQGDKARQELSILIDKIEQYHDICERALKITYADKTYLIKEAEKLLFAEEILVNAIEIDPKEKPQMFTDPASINRDLLDR